MVILVWFVGSFYDALSPKNVPSLHPSSKGYPNNQNLLPQIPNFLNTHSRGANTYCNENS